MKEPSRATLVHLSSETVRELLTAPATTSLPEVVYDALPSHLRARLPRHPDPMGFELGPPLLTHSLMAEEPATVRRQAEAWAQSQSPVQRSIGMDRLAEWAELSIIRSTGDHYIFPLYYRSQKVAEVWAPVYEVAETRGLRSPTEKDVKVLSYYRVLPEVREIVQPEVALARSGLELKPGVSTDEVELYYFGSSRYGLVPVYAVPSRDGLRLVEAHAGHVKLFLARPTDQSSMYAFRGQSVEIEEVVR